MKNILCFGDSNTWGYIPGTGQRYPANERWTGVLQQILGDQYRVIEEGLNGRTTMFEDQFRDLRNGLALLPVYLESHAPLDLVVIMLGTNDLKSFFDLPIGKVAEGAKKVCEAVLEHEFTVGCCPEILLVSPTWVEILPQEARLEFAGATEKSRLFYAHYQMVAKTLGIGFFNAAPVVQTSPVDGVHWAQVQHQHFGEVIAKIVIESLA